MWKILIKLRLERKNYEKILSLSSKPYPSLFSCYMSLVSPTSHGHCSGQLWEWGGDTGDSPHVGRHGLVAWPLLCLWPSQARLWPGLSNELSSKKPFMCYKPRLWYLCDPLKIQGRIFLSFLWVFKELLVWMSQSIRRTGRWVNIVLQSFIWLLLKGFNSTLMREVLCLIQMKILSQVFLLRTPSEGQWQGGSLDKTLGIRLKVSRGGGRKEADPAPLPSSPLSLCIFVRGNTKYLIIRNRFSSFQKIMWVICM